jgi:hypothetical protein
MGADPGDDAGRLPDGPGTGVDVGAAQFGRQQMPAADDVERQIAVAVVITAEKAPLLIAVQRVVGGVEVENDLRRRMLVRIDEQIDKRCFDRLWVVADPVIGGRLVGAQFEPVERRFARHGGAVPMPCGELAGQYRHDRVMAQFVMIKQILIAECHAEHPPADNRRHRMLDLILRPVVAEAPRKPLDQPGGPVGRRPPADLANQRRTNSRAPQVI